MSRQIGTALFFLFSSIVLLQAREINLDLLASKAAQQQKHLFVWLHKTDCSYCEAMQDFTLEDEKVASVIRASFDFVHINIREKDSVAHRGFEGDGHAFARHVGYNFYPSSLFMDAQGVIVFAAPGYVEERDFLKMLEFVRTGAYKTMGYNTFRSTGEKE